MYLLSVIWNVSINQSVFLAERCAHRNVTIDTNPTEFRNFGLSLQYGLSAGKGGEYTHCRPDMSPRHRSYTAAVEKKNSKETTWFADLFCSTSHVKFAVWALLFLRSKQYENHICVNTRRSLSFVFRYTSPKLSVIYVWCF